MLATASPPESTRRVSAFSPIASSLKKIGGPAWNRTRLKNRAWLLRRHSANGPWQIVAWAENHVALSIAGLLFWALANGLLVFSPGYAVMPTETKMGLAALPPLHLMLALVGALALCALGALLSKLSFMNWLRWLGEHSLFVYVAFTLPMSIFRGLAMWSGAADRNRSAQFRGAHCRDHESSRPLPHYLARRFRRFPVCTAPLGADSRGSAFNTGRRFGGNAVIRVAHNLV